MASFKKLIEDLGVSEVYPKDSIRAFRKGLGLTLKDVEHITGIRESHLSAIENGKIDITQHYAEVFASTFGVHPTVFLYPNGEFKKSNELKAIEQRALKYINKARAIDSTKSKKRVG